MGIEYIAVIAEDDYHAFKILVSTTLPREYEMWLRVRERGKLRAIRERAAAVLVEVEVCPEEFGAYCKGLKRPDFSLATLDRCAREKANAPGRGTADRVWKEASSPVNDARAGFPYERRYLLPAFSTA